MRKKINSLLLMALMVALSACSLFNQGTPAPPKAANVALEKPVEVSETYTSAYREYSGPFAVDGDWDSEASRWISGAGSTAPHWLRIDLEGMHTLESAEVWTGVPGQGTSVVPDFKLQYQSDGEWVDIPGASVEGNEDEHVTFTFATPIITDHVQFFSSVDTDRVRVREILIFGYPNEEGGGIG